MTIVSQKFNDMSVRGTGVGRMIMDEAIRVVEEKFGKVPIMIHADDPRTLGIEIILKCHKQL